MYILLLFISILLFYHKKFYLNLEIPYSMPILAYFGPKTLKQNSFLRLYVALTSFKKSKSFHTSTFHKTQKTSFLGLFCTFWPKNPRISFFLLQNPALSLSKVYNTVTSFKKLENF